MDQGHETEVPLRGMLIDGEIVEASDGATMPSENPTTEARMGALPVATTADVHRAVEAARRASRSWSELPWEERARVLHVYADVLDAHREELALLDALDAGLPVKSMRADVTSAVAEIRYFAGLASETKGTTFPSGPGAVTFTEFVPYPVVARIVPFNHPIKFAAGKCAAALAAGAPVVIKPGEQTSLSALRLGELVRDVFPAGVYNIITGPGATVGALLAGHPAVPRVAFTGSVATGARITELGAPYIKHVSLELGGKNPLIVMPDADPADAARGAVGAMNFARSMGQSCGSTSRAFVHGDIYDDFVAHLVEAVAGLKVGDPLDPGTDMGPLAFRAHHNRVLEFIEAGRNDGAKLLYGGGLPTGVNRGFFVEPTVFGNVDMTMRIAREEIFGPVLSVLRWTDYEQMLDDANGLDVGLTGNVWTNDISLALKTARRIESGYITVNGTGRRPSGSPFGGFKQSGIGKESSLDELLSYGRERAVNITLR
ncbi:aldehyde dehydrogenase family protein [Micromonospora sp. NPDC023966]|uniref:aldehyde dehydrogenase family protein n=1 Tax=Micromonospora sp. NPDC023966 TaxID=3154699 RepID=UPI0033E5CB9D